MQIEAKDSQIKSLESQIDAYVNLKLKYEEGQEQYEKLSKRYTEEKERNEMLQQKLGGLDSIGSNSSPTTE